MKYLKYQWPIIALAFLFFIFSCREDNNIQEIPKGKISIGLQADPSISIATGRLMSVNTDSFRVAICNAAGMEIIAFEDFIEIQEEIEVDTGEYYVTAKSDNSSSAAFDNPIYSGTSNRFHVKANEVAPVFVNCSISNFLISVLYSEKLADHFNGWETMIFNNSDTLVFEQNETRAGYFELTPVTVHCTLYYTKSDLSPGVIDLSGIIADPKPKTHYMVNIISPEVNGFLNPIEIVVDESVDTVNITLNDCQALKTMDGILALYPFDNNLIDAGSGHFNGIGQGTILFSEQLMCNSALKLKDTSEYHMYNGVHIPNSLPTDEYTVAFWMSLDTLKNHHSIFMLNRTNNWMYSDFWIFIAEKRIAVLQNLKDTRRTNYVINSTFSGEFLASTELQSDETFFIACVYKLQTIYIYINGRLDAIYPNIGPHTNTSQEGEILIGICPNPNDMVKPWAYQYIGALDEFAIFNRGLSEGEIKAIYLLGINI
ncbi:MAG TPA: DUF4493 domain-containing protein [Cyclobacteriaceae bacterium]|nr:DUF4493 domain-containing protein [Cyclobacteriaceae bacterium]